MIAPETNCNGNTMNWLMPISASCWRTSSAIAFDSDAMITAMSTAASEVIAIPLTPPGNRAPAAYAIPNTINVWSTVVSAW